MGGYQKTTVAQVRAALCAADGVIPRAALALGVSRQALHKRINSSPDLQACIQEMADDLKDFARGNIYKALKEGDGTMTRWFAGRKMQDEGYGNRPPEPGVDIAKIEAIVEAIAEYGGAPALRAVQAILTT